MTGDESAELPVIAGSPPQVRRWMLPPCEPPWPKPSAGEVRFDRLSRALYSTDASVYQIVPLGVVLPRTRPTSSPRSASCARFGVPLRPAAAARRRPARRSGRA